MVKRSPDIGTICAGTGAYLLTIDLTLELVLDIAMLGRPVLAPGRYVYCGSAYGPGGIKARVARHLRQNKALRWHVDRLTLGGHVTHVAALVGGSECELMAGLCVEPGVSVPLLRFGSSDCRVCPAHLAAVPAKFDIGVFVSDFRSPS